jgi:iron complex transport system ATP-binding protein
MTTGMIELADRALDTLSGGQRQRAWIAMALAQDTRFSCSMNRQRFLDLAHQVEVLDLLYELNQSEGTNDCHGAARLEPSLSLCR